MFALKIINDLFFMRLANFKIEGSQQKLMALEQLFLFLNIHLLLLKNSIYLKERQWILLYLSIARFSLIRIIIIQSS
ncbi:MAG: hypothetical protein A2W85_01875 [Bacteroidetes bacterium GWF2_41_31]|nr:MAG: hypothetical protein A2W85_01875 [Bacteroidetes bacterium GWF2_41_31]